jgi:hypothetical protein
VRLPRLAQVSVVCDGSPTFVEHAAAIDLDIDRAGVYSI